MQDSRRTALITGASGGIGLDLARQAAADGHDLILVARSADKLQAIAAELRQTNKGKVEVIPADLSEIGAAASLWQEIANRGLQVDVLMNNAGIGHYGPFLERDAASDSQMLQLNMITLTELTRLAAQEMVARGHGRILNVASTAAFQPGPLMATYYASKAYVLSFSEALGNELAGTGVTVTALCPGPTRSGFQEKAEMEESRMLKLGMMESAPVADIGYRAMKKGRSVVIAGATNAMLAQSVRFMPRSIVTKVSRKVAEKSH